MGRDGKVGGHAEPTAWAETGSGRGGAGSLQACEQRCRRALTTRRGEVVQRMCGGWHLAIEAGLLLCLGRL